MQSNHIADFLRFIREAEQLQRIAAANEQEANDETQDILHALELQSHTYHERAKLANKLVVIRKSRRSAKELFEVISPIAQWAQENAAVIKSLERLLGEVRKAEKRIQNRVYTPKTEVCK